MTRQVYLIRGDADAGSTITLNAKKIHLRDTREPKSLAIPFADPPLRIIFDTGMITRYIVISGVINQPTSGDAYSDFNDIQTAVESWWNALTYGALPTLRIQYDADNTVDYTGSISKFQVDPIASNDTLYEYELEFLQGQEENV